METIILLILFAILFPSLTITLLTIVAGAFALFVCWPILPLIIVMGALGGAVSRSMSGE